MIMRAAGAGGGVVHALALGDGRKKIPAWMWAAVAASALFHVGAGIWIYQQRFVEAEPIAVPQPPPTIVTMTHLPPPTTTKEAHPRPIPVHDPKTSTDKAPVHLTVPAVPDDPTAKGPPILVLDPPPPGPLTGGEGKAVAKGPSVINDPKWLSQPDADAMSRYYPGPAASAGIEGRASISCTVTVRGTLANCAVVSESPGGQGFGRSALRLAQYFRMSPKTVDGQPVEGARVTVPIRFRMGG
jgi:protein TonB